MKENIRVLVRVKPLAEGEDSCLAISGKGQISLTPTQAFGCNHAMNASRRAPAILNTPHTPGASRVRLSFTPNELSDLRSDSGDSNQTAPIQLQSTRSRKERKKSTGPLDPQTFHFDRVFNDSASQAQIFSQIDPYIRAAVGGYNASIFAYG